MEAVRAPLRIVPPPAPSDADGPLSLAQAYRLYSRYVAAIAVRLLGRDDEVDDVVQDVFLRAHKGLAQLRDPQAARGWLATVTVRVARRKLRWCKIGRVLGLTESGDYDQLAAEGASAEDRAVLARLYAVLDQMAVEHRIAWALRHVEGQKLEDVAELTGCSLATAKRRIAAAQQTIDGAFDHER